MMHGMLVLELANVLAGPTVCQFMAELGADVIKVENSSTEGDVTRTWKLAAETSECQSTHFSGAVTRNTGSALSRCRQTLADLMLCPS